jgi:hypothetical protein
MTSLDRCDLIEFSFPDEINQPKVSEQQDGPVEPIELNVSVPILNKSTTCVPVCGSSDTFPLGWGRGITCAFGVPHLGPSNFL